MQPNDSLQYPTHFPPTIKWKRFFIGVRLFGPDLSFFKNIHSTQAGRLLGSMNIWGKPQAFASSVSLIFSKHCNWASVYFFPSDNVSVIASGPRFGWADTDLHEAIAEIEQLVGIKMAPAFWEASGAGTLGQLVDQLLEVRESRGVISCT